MFLFFMFVDDKGNVNPRRLIIKHDLLAITGPHNISYPTKPQKYVILFNKERFQTFSLHSWDY